MTKAPRNSPLTIDGPRGGRASLRGELTAKAPGAVWDKLLGTKKLPGPLVLDLGELSGLDLNGAAQLLWLRDRFRAGGAELTVENLPGRLQPIWDLAVNTLGPPVAPPRKPSLLEVTGRILADAWSDALALTGFMGELLYHLGGVFRRPWSLRRGATMAQAQTAVVDALPVTALVSFLVGLILAFQSAMFMRMFGVDIFVADLVGLALIRELGTLLTAIVLTGRSGSAFSAELGAMKANQEIDAFVTMGLSPGRDLVLPRVAALTVATPLLTVLADFAGLLGGNLVMVTLGHPVSVFWTELAGHIGASDIATGLFKSFVFGFSVAAIGCQRGLAAGSGPMAVGEATTRGVVTNIVVLSVLDSLFAVLFYVLRW